MTFREVDLKLFNQLLCILYLVFFSSSLFAVEEQPLIVVMNADSYPYQFIDDKGAPQGILVDLWKDWSLLTAIDVEFVVRDWEDVLVRDDIDQTIVHIGTTARLESKEQFDVAKPIWSANSYLYLSASLINKRNISELQPYKIGIVSDSSCEDELLAVEPGLVFKRYNNRQDLLQGALAGEVFAFADSEVNANNSAHNQVTALFPTSNRLLIKQNEIRPVIINGQASLIQQIDIGFSQIPDERMSEIEVYWLGAGQQKGGIRIASTVNIEPYVNIGGDGNLHGLYVDMWDLWSEKTGVPITFTQGTMKSTIALVREGKADVHIGYPESESLKTGLQREELLYRVKSRLFSLNKPIGSLDELTHSRIGAVPTAPYLDKLSQQLPDADIRLYGSVDAMIEAVISGEISSFVASSAWTQHYLVQKGVAPDFYQFMGLEYSTDIYVLSAGENSELSESIKQGFALISRVELAEIEQKWMLDNNNRIFVDELASIQLSMQESEHLKRLPTLKVGYQKNWKPMEFTDSQGDFAGVNGELIQLLQDRLGIKVEAVEYQEWQGLISALISGEVDIAGSVASTPERLKTLMFSEPYWPSPWALATPMDKESVFNIQQLKGQRVAVVEGYQLINELIGPEFGVELVLVADTEAGLKAVTDGLADAFIEKVINMAAQLKQSEMSQLKMSVLADFSEQQSHFGVHPSKAELVPLINMVLESVEQSSRQKIYQRWVIPTAGELSSAKSQWNLVFGLILLMLVVLLISLKIMLGREVNKRKRLERQLLDLTHYDTLTALPNRTLLNDRLEQTILLHARELSTFAILFVGFDGIKSINAQCGHHAGEQLTKTLAELITKSVRRSDTVARFGSEEFVVILNRTKSLDIVCQVAENIINHLSDDFDVEQLQVNIHTSIGVARYPSDGDGAAELLNAAEKLMFKAKESGGNCYKSS